MILTKVVDIGIANLCCASASAGHDETFRNSGDGAATQLIYLLYGVCYAKCAALDSTIAMVPGQIVDLSSIMGFPIEGRAEQESMWVSINPKPKSKRFDYRLLESGASISHTGDSEEQYLVSLVGSIHANEKTIPEHKFARIALGQQVVVQVPDGSAAIILTTRQ
jgi:hypothetical protein